jgi:SMI1/KNR4 family protein SUKH-1
MTRAELLRCLSKLEKAADLKGLRTDAAIGDPAAEHDIAQLEATLHVVLPTRYRESLREWNGFTVEIREPSGPGTRERLHAQWVVHDIRSTIAATEVTRHQMAEGMAGNAVASQVAQAMSQIVVFVYEDDIIAFLSCDDRELDDSPVQSMNLEYAVGQYPPTMHVIATSLDEYFEKAFDHLAKTLETEIYWW